MKKKAVTGFILASVFAIGMLVACTPADTSVAPTPPVQTAPDTATAVAPDAVPPPPEADLGRGITLAAASETPSIAPARHSSLLAGFKNSLTHNNLFRAHYTDLNPTPELVSDWHAISDTVFEFRLHEGILFHNGDELTAYDVVSSLEYVRTHPYSRAHHGSIAYFEVVDLHTFRLDTGEPNAMLFFDLTSHANAIMPRSLIESGHDFTTNPVGSGPFVFEDWRAATL